MNAIGLIELNSIASGFEVADAMLKAAEVELILARTICSGKYVVIVGGDVATVRSSVDSGLGIWESAIIDTMVIPNVHPSVFPAIAGTNTGDDSGALGIIEAFSVASLIQAADAAVKAARVKLIEIRLAMALGGKAFVTLTGEVAAVRAAVDAGARIVADKGLLVNKVVIAAPSPQLYKEYI
ncbi:BMC domain-containing protein [candidate division KSB1 bacterium]|nr:BMC domain-containing protein [candidate division KSB1 bacterium]